MKSLILSLMLLGVFSILTAQQSEAVSFGCEEDLWLSSYTLEYEIYAASDSLASISTISATDTVRFQAGTVIILEAGFHANATSNFHAKIEPCNVGFPLPNEPDFYDYLRFYNTQAPNDTSEGSLLAQLKKAAIIWSPRLNPTGDPSFAAEYIIGYVRDFNNGNISCATTSNWECIGPFKEPLGNVGAAGTGQIHTIRFSPKFVTDSIVYAGSNWGGLWRRVGSNDWEMLNTDTQLPFTSVSDIAIHPTDTDTLFIGTGDAEMTLGHHAQNPNAQPSAFTPIFTGGVYRSFDGGSTWTHINGINQELLDFFEDGGAIRKIIINPNNPNQLFIASSGGVFRCNNALAASPSWAKLTNNFDDFELKGLEFQPANPDTIYTSGVGIYQSVDNGDTWASITGASKGLDLDNLPDNFRVMRINITVTPANPNIIYAHVISTNAARTFRWEIYRYDGSNWTFLDQEQASAEFITPQRIAIAASPVNENEIYIGAVRLIGSNDYTSSSIRNLSPEYGGRAYHADVHALAFNPANLDELFCGTDGGIHIKDLTIQTTSDASFEDISDGLAVVTPYGLDDTEGRTDRIIIGNQDTGTSVYENGEWETILGGDGFNGDIDNKTGLGFGSQNSAVRKIFSYNFETGAIVPEFSSRYRPTDPKNWSNRETDRFRAIVRGAYDVINHPTTERMFFTMSELYERLENRQGMFGDTPDDLWEIKSNIGQNEETEESWKRQFLTELDISISDPN